MKKYKSNIDKLELKRIKSNIPRAKITKSKESEEYIRQFWGDDIVIYESFFILLLNKQNNTVGYAKISQGGVCGTVVDVSIIAKYAVEALASSIIVAHNHPSGNIKPSKQDVDITLKIKESLMLFDIKLLDHIIITEDSYTSLVDEGLL